MKIFQLLSQYNTISGGPTVTEARCRSLPAPPPPPQHSRKRFILFYEILWRMFCGATRENPLSPRGFGLGKDGIAKSCNFSLNLVKYIKNYWI